MPKKRKLSSVNEKCRLCLGDDGCMGDIFAEDLRPKINDLAESTSIHINDDGNFPRNICHVCLYKLDMWFDFKKQFVRSNVMLREHLELSELSDNAASTTKRKLSEVQECAVDGPSEQGDAKKLKMDLPTSISVSAVGQECETPVAKPRSADEGPADNEGTLQNNVPENIAADEPTEFSANTSDVRTPAASVSPKSKPAAGRRSKTTERRKASTKRWVARKRALLAATGENDTDSDTMSSDDPQLSPVQKARAKSNAEKLAETQRKMARSLKNFDSNVSAYGETNADSDGYVIGETDSGMARANEPVKTAPAPAPTNGSDLVRRSPNDGGLDVKIASNSKSQLEAPGDSKITDDYLPHSVRSELIVDDATFVVTSTLALSDPRCASLSQTTGSTSPPAEDPNPERNTDIIDAVQLRRVSPKSLEKRDKKFVESCLNIEVEGTELDALRRVQADLAGFVEHDMRIKFCRDDPSADDVEATKDSLHSLDRQLRTIVEKAVKKNLDSARCVVNNRGNNTFTSDFVRAALRSRIFQPRVTLLRLDATRLRESARKSSIDDDSAKAKTAERNSDSLSVSRGKRRCVQPIKYADYDTSPNDPTLDESRESSVVDEEPKATSPGAKSSKVKTYGPASAKQILPTVNQREGKRTKIISQQQSKNSSLTSDNATKISPSRSENSTKDSPSPGESSTKNSPPTSEKLTKVSPSDNDENIGEKHICALCGETFGTAREVEIHFASHKNSIPSAIKQPKQKMMRCKRCHEIVEARYVKSHVCLALRSLHKCYSCNFSFKTEKMLTRHLASHSFDDRDGKIDVVPRRETRSRLKSELADDAAETDSTTHERSNGAKFAGSTRECYTCFVCDKTFTDEEILKDHLQKHCDDMSDDQRSSGKDYQCAICGDSLDSEDALESHVEKHLFDDEDDNPNLISIGGSGDVDKINSNETARCGQCAEEFDSEMLLMLHMQAHDEEVAIAEWERRGIDNGQHVCVICDDVFATEIDLSDHIDVHNGNAHICQLCDKPFLTLEELQSHVNTH